MDILRVQDNAVMLVVRMQAYAYSNVKLRHLDTAELFAESCLAAFKAMVEDLGAANTEQGYWMNFYYDRFVADCAALTVR